MKGKIVSWGTRLTIPAPIIKEAGFAVGDDVIFAVIEDDDEKVITVRRKR